MFIRMPQQTSIEPRTAETAAWTPITEVLAEAWPSFFGALTACSEELLGTVTVVGSHAPAYSRRPLREITYSSDEDVLALTVGFPSGVGELRYFIRAPRRIRMAHNEGATELLVEEAGGTLTLICLFEVNGRGALQSTGWRRSEGATRRW
jgi:hypothetical protein